MEKLPVLPAGSVILQPGVQHSWYQGPAGGEQALLPLDHPMPHATQDLAALNMNSVGTSGINVAMYGRMVGEDQIVNMSTAANNSALYPKPQYHTPLGRSNQHPLDIRIIQLRHCKIAYYFQSPHPISNFLGIRNASTSILRSLRAIQKEPSKTVFLFQT